MRIRNGIVTTLHAYSADSEFTNVLKGRYITNVINNNVIVLDNDMHLHIQIDTQRAFLENSSSTCSHQMGIPSTSLYPTVCPEKPSIIAPELSTRRISTIHEKDIHHG